MSEIRIIGGRSLEGLVPIHGAKNSVLPILAATVLVPGVSVIRNCPDLSDVRVSLRILEHLGCKTTREGDTVTVDASGLTCCDVPDDLMREMRSSVIFLGAILGRTGCARLNLPGGCELGPRPIDLHLSALRDMGAVIEEGEQGLNCARSCLKGRDITLAFPSVGATENVMLAACAAQGVTTIRGAAREPEIEDLQRFLTVAGARVRGAGTSEIVIEGGVPLHGGVHTVMGDRIVAVTYLSACACAGGDVTVTGIDPRHLDAVSTVFRRAGCEMTARADTLRLRRAGEASGTQYIHTAPYPGFPTDAQAPVMAALSVGKGTAVMTENMFENRYRHVKELERMGARIRVNGRVAVVEGVHKLHAAAVKATDLRGGAALAVAALGAEGESVLTGLHHVDRGYQSIENDLRLLGAEIQRTE